MNQNTTHATNDEEIPIEFRNYVTFAKRPRDAHSSDYVSTETEEDSDPSTPTTDVDEKEYDESLDNDNQQGQEMIDAPDNETSIQKKRMKAAPSWNQFHSYPIPDPTTYIGSTISR